MSSIDLANQTGLIPQHFYSVSSNQAKIVQADSDGILITNTATSRSLGLGAGGFLVDGTTTIDPLNLTAVSNNIVPTSLNIVDNISITDNSVDNSISIQAGQNGGVGTFFGLDYESTTNQDFTIQSSSSGGILYKQYGTGATTKQLRLDPTEIIMANTANNNTNTITETQIEVKQDPTSTTTPSTTTITPNSIQSKIHNNISGFDNIGSLNSSSVNFSDSATTNNTNLSITGVNVNGTTATWTDIINSTTGSNTYQQVLTAGNTANELSAVIDGTGTIGTSTATTNKLGFQVQDSNGAGQDRSSSLQNNGVFCSSQVPFGYNDSLVIELFNSGSGAGSGIFHFDNYPTPSDFRIQSDQNILLTTPKELSLQSTSSNIFMDGQNIQLQTSYLAIPNISASEYTQLQNQGLNCVDTANGWNTWYRKTSAFISNTAGTIATYITNTSVQVQTTTDTTNMSAGDLQQTNATTGSSSLLRSLGQLLINTFNTGFTANPIIELKNSNTTAGDTTGVPSVHYYKQGRNVVVGDYIASQHFYAKNYLGTKTEFGRLTYQTTNSSAGGGDDGAFGVWCAVNGTTQNVFTFNGADNENNSFRPLDLNGNALKTATLNLNIDASASSGTGQIILTPKAGSVIILNNLPTSSAGLPAGAVWRNGSVLNIV